MRSRICISFLLFALSCLGFFDLHASYFEGVTWEEVEIKNNTGELKEYWLESNRHAYVDLYYSIDGGDSLHKRSGKLVPYRLRDVPFDGRVIIGVKLEGGQTLRGRLRLESRLFVAPIPDGRPPEIQLRENREMELWIYHSFHLVVIGIVIFLFLYNLTLYISTRFERYRFYVPGLLAMVLELTRASGLLTSLLGFWDAFPFYEDYIGVFANFGILLCAPMGARDILEIPTRFPKIDRYFRYYPWLATFAFVSTLLFLPVGYEVLIWGAPFPLLFFSIILFLHLRKRYRYGLILFFGIQCYILASFLIWAGTFNVIPMHDDYINPIIAIGTIVLDVSMTMVLAKMVWDLRRENASQQQRIIENLHQEKDTRKRIALEVAKAREEVRQGFAQRLKSDLESQLRTIQEEVSSIEAYSDPKDADLEILYRQLLDETQESIERTREIAHELMPEDLGGSDSLLEAVEEYLDGLRGRGIPIEYVHSGKPQLALPIRALAYRILRDLVACAMKQGRGKQLKVDISFEKALLTIKADYQGFEDEELVPELNRVLEASRMNVSLYGGTLALDAHEEEAIRISVQIPTT